MVLLTQIPSQHNTLLLINIHCIRCG